MQATNKMQQIPFIDLFKSALHVLGDKLAHPQGHFFDCIYGFWYDAQILLPTGDKVEMFHLNLVTGWPYIQSKSAPEDGRVCRPKHVEPIKKVNKRNLLHLVGCLHRCSNDARSHKHQICELC